jgi:hypothetical protein
MIRSSLQLLALLVTFIASDLGHSEPPAAPENADVFGEFTGSTPCGEPIGKLFDIPADATPPVHWSRTLYQNAETKAPTRYKLRVEFDGAKAPAAGKPVSKEKLGRWSIGKGTKSDQESVVYRLDGAVNLIRLSGDVLHALNPDRSLALGTAGWSHTLSRLTAAEKIVVPSAAWLQQSESCKLAPLATGLDVFGVFEGRTPAQGIARDLHINTDANRNKLKWRVTLYRDPTTTVPTRYKVESSLHRDGGAGVREGTWAEVQCERGAQYHLVATKTEAALLLLRGDDNVLFLLGPDHKPKVGNAEFSYTLNRRVSSLANR